MRHDHAYRSTPANAAQAALRAITFGVAMVCALATARSQDVNSVPSSSGGAQTHQVRPAQSQGSGVASPSPNVAESLLKSYYEIKESPAASASGEPLSLRRVLYGAYNPSERLRRLFAYWDFSYRYAYLNLCVAYQADVKACVNKVTQKYGSSAPNETAEFLGAVNQIADERRAAAKLTFVQAQYDFDAAFTTAAGRRAAIERAQTAGKSVGQGYAILYVPATAPATNAYNTRFDELAQTRVMSPEAARLNSQIPLLYETLQKRASLSARLRALLERDFSSATVADDALFTALENDFEAKVEVLKAAVRYNQAIASYAAQTIPASVNVDAFLITIGLRVVEQGGATGSGATGTVPSGAASPTNRPATSSFYRRMPGLESYDDASNEEGYVAESTLEKTEPGALAMALNLTEPTYSLATLGYSVSSPTQPKPRLLTVGYVTPLTTTLIPEEQTTQNAAAQPTPLPQPEPVPPQPAPTQPEPPQPMPEPAQDVQPAPAPATQSEEAKPAEPQSVPEENKEPPKTERSEPPQEEPLSAQSGAALPGELTAAAPDVVFPIVLFVTGYELPRANAPTEKKDFNSSDKDAPDGAFLFKRDFNLVARVRELVETLWYEVDELARKPREDEERTWIVRGQEPSASPSDPTNAAGRANASASETDRLVAQRAQEIGRALFAVPIVAASAQMTGEEERLFSLQETLQRAAAFAPAARARVVEEYWRLFAAVAKLRVEETMLQTYVSLYEKSSGTAREERALAVALEAQARVAEARAVKRGVQTNLLRLMALTQGTSAYPLPSTQPFCGVRFNLGSPAYPNAETLRVGALIQDRLKATQTLGGAVRSPSELLNIDLTNVTDSNFEVALAALAKKRERTLGYIDQIIQLNFAITEYVAYYPGHVSNDRFVDAIVGR